MHVPILELGKLLCLGRPLDYFPNSCIPGIRTLYTKLLDEVINDPFNDEAHKRLFIFQIVIMLDPGNKRRHNIAEKLHIMKQNKFSDFTLGDFAGRRGKQDSSNISNVIVSGKVDSDALITAKRMARVRRLVSLGEVSRAFNALTSDAKPASA